jgi:hypothetical protein
VAVDWPGHPKVPQVQRLKLGAATSLTERFDTALGLAVPQSVIARADEVIE